MIVDDIGDHRSVLVAPAQDISPDEVNLILAVCGGITFVAISQERANAFMLPPMPGAFSSNSSEQHSTALHQYISVEAREGVTTGISTSDRAATLRILGSRLPHPRSLVKPGHIFPVGTKEGGTLVKAAIPEAALDATVLAGFSDAALFVDFLGQDGDFLSPDKASQWATAHGVPLLTLSQLIQHRLILEPLITRLSEAELPTLEAGNMRAIAYRSLIHDVEHIALVKGEITPLKPSLVRVQVENTVADVFGEPEPGTRWQISESLKAMNERGSGVLLYLRRSSIAQLPLFSSSTAAQGYRRSEATSMREYGVGAQILRDLGATQIELLSSTQRNLAGLDSFGISVVNQRSLTTQTLSNQEQ